MRKPENNPTERIGRLMDEMAELIAIVQAQVPHMLPRLPMYEAERVRRSLTYTRNVNHMRTRHAMNTAMDQPYRAAVGKEKLYHDDAKKLADEMTSEPLSIEDIELALTESKRKEVQDIIERGQNAGKIGDNNLKPQTAYVPQRKKED